MSGWRYVAFCVHVLYNGIVNPCFDVFIANFIHDHVKEHYTVERLLKTVRIAHLEGIQGWLSKFGEDGESAYDKLVEDGCLTKRGLKLLLWDQGVIRPA